MTITIGIQLNRWKTPIDYSSFPAGYVSICAGPTALGSRRLCEELIHERDMLKYPFFKYNGLSIP